MGQIGYSKLTPQAKGELFLGNDCFSFPYNDPDIGIDYCGLSGTIVMNQYIDIVNNSTFSVYFKIIAQVLSGDPTKWSNLEVEIGEVSASGKLTYNWQPQRIVPVSKTAETLRLSMKAYTDAEYSELYGEDFTDYNYYFFSHSLGTVVHFGDFEGTMDGWSQNPSTFAVGVEANAYTGAQSLRMTEEDADNESVDGSGQTIPTQTKYISQTFNLSSYSTAYLVLHPTFLFKGASGKSLAIFRIWTSTKDFIIRVPITDNTFQPFRIAVPLPCVSGYVRITALFKKTEEDTDYYSYMDSIIVVGFI